MKKRIKQISLSVVVLFGTYFIYISNQRFSEDVLYANLIPSQSLIKNPVLYSYFDYLSQWYFNSLFVLKSYNFNTFSGQITFQSILSLFGQYGIINYNAESFLSLRKTLWPDNWYTFNGFVAYSVYDYGYLLTTLLSIGYYLIIKKLRPKNNTISLVSLFFVVFLIQMPLMAIFYSTVGGVVFPLIMFIPIFIYLKFDFKF